MAQQSTAALDTAELTQMVKEFYHKADEGAPLVELLPYIAEDMHMYWTPTCQFDGHVGFEEFYENLIRSQFDRHHEVSNIQVKPDGDTAEVTFTIHLTARQWFPPAPKSVPAENHADFVWKVRRSPATGRPVIFSYVLTRASFPEGAVIVIADIAFKYVRPMWGPFDFPPKQ